METIFFPHKLAAKIAKPYFDLGRMGAQARLRHVQNKAKHFTDGMGQNSTGK